MAVCKMEQVNCEGEVGAFEALDERNLHRGCLLYHQKMHGRVRNQCRLRILSMRLEGPFFP